MTFRIGDRVVIIDSRHPYYQYNGIISHAYVTSDKYEILLNAGGICDAGSYQLDFDFNNSTYPENENIPSAGPKCECGAEKTGQPGHSSYCPKYIDLMGRKK